LPRKKLYKISPILCRAFIVSLFVWHYMNKYRYTYCLQLFMVSC
jgi:hypothetical protein